MPRCTYRNHHKHAPGTGGLIDPQGQGLPVSTQQEAPASVAGGRPPLGPGHGPLSSGITCTPSWASPHPPTCRAPAPEACGLRSGPATFTAHVLCQQWPFARGWRRLGLRHWFGEVGRASRRKGFGILSPGQWGATESTGGRTDEVATSSPGRRPPHRLETDAPRVQR